jgi:hypothetical protein
MLLDHPPSESGTFRWAPVEQRGRQRRRDRKNTTGVPRSTRPIGARCSSDERRDVPRAISERHFGGDVDGASFAARMPS